MRPVKCFPRLIEALAPVARRRSEVMLLMVGDGPERRRIEAEIRRHGLAARARLVGERDDVRGHLAAMDVFVLPSDMEGTSLALLEASWCGLAAVATDVGGNAEVIEDGVSGTLVKRDDAAALGNAIELYAGDRGAARAHGQRARERVRRRYSWTAFVDAHDALYRELAPT
jgi:glycosyltransferase involved in cell wall biosynthesis